MAVRPSVVMLAAAREEAGDRWLSLSVGRSVGRLVGLPGWSTEQTRKLGWISVSAVPLGETSIFAPRGTGTPLRLDLQADDGGDFKGWRRDEGIRGASEKLGEAGKQRAGSEKL